jgi:molecular chaperone HtpG
MSTDKQTLGFQTEVKQLLHIMVHSLYSHKEIFLRELISNASDALDKLRFEALANNKLYGDDPQLKITVDFDPQARTVTLSDNGIGMTKDEIINHLGTIARSGTKEFLSALSGDQKKDAALIGQFGVGFYSSFIVADKVSVHSLRAGHDPKDAVLWESAGEGDYTIEAAPKTTRGTQVTLHLKKDEGEFLDNWRLRQIINKYSDHISFPVDMRKLPQQKAEESEEDAKEAQPEVPEYEQVNKATALWTRSKSEIPDEEYKDFYQHISHDFSEPLLWSHNRVEGKLEYTSLLYIPSRAPYDLFNRERNFGLKLYVQRVFILDDVEQFLPNYLRFVRGVIDSNDLPLNVSREILQNSKVVESIKGALTKRVLDVLEKLAQDDAEKYGIFWDQFGNVIKEGPIDDFANRERIAKLVRFASTQDDQAIQRVSLDDYISRMREGQDKIYYITAENFSAAKQSPQLEIFREKGIEVLLLSDRIDEWLINGIPEYQGKALQSVAKGSLDIDSLDSAEVKEQQEKVAQNYKSLVEQLTEALKERVKEVRTTARLRNSPACVVADDYDMGMQMQRIMQAAGQQYPMSKPILEINPEHPLIKKLNDEPDVAQVSEWGHILLDQAILAEGGHIPDPADFVQRLNKMFLGMV